MARPGGGAPDMMPRRWGNRSDNSVTRPDRIHMETGPSGCRRGWGGAVEVAPALDDGASGCQATQGVTGMRGPGERTFSLASSHPLPPHHCLQEGPPSCAFRLSSPRPYWDLSPGSLRLRDCT